MTTVYNNTRMLGIAFAALVLLAVPFAFASKAHAADLFGGDTYGDYYPSDMSTYGDYYPTSGGDVYPDTYGNVYPDTYSNTYPDTTSYSYPDSSSYGSYDYGYTPGYGSSSFFGGGFPFGGGSYGAPSNTNTNVNTNTNTCTTNSCNTTISTPINAPTTIVNSGNNTTPSTPVYQPVYQPIQQPVYYPSQPVYQPSYNPCTTCGCNGVYCNTQRPAPYVSLSAVPYTGLDLGPVGTAMYWGFLVLWCLGAAYLIAVKRIQNTIVAKIFGNKKAAAHTATVSHATHAPVKKAESAPSISKFGNIDPFIASQLNKLA